jgi:phosphatidate cytidylyltransferase
MLGSRLLISSILIPALIGLFVIDNRLGPRALLLLVLCQLLAARSVYEMVLLLRHRSFAPHLLLTGGLTLAVIAASWQWTADLDSQAAIAVANPGLALMALAYTAAVLLLLLKGAIAFREAGTSMQNLGGELLIVSYVGVLIAVTAQLRWVAGPQAGYLALGSLIIAAKCGDIGAYTLGRLFGKKKMVPRLSPAKTWAGAWGALLGAGFGALLWLQLATPRFNSSWAAPPWYWSAAFGVFIGVAGLLGDLCESLIKRDVGQKDSAALLPGFGGLLDLLDSILYAGPVAYVLWQVMPLQTW